MPAPVYSPYMQAEIAKADNWFPMIAGAHPEIVNIDSLWSTTRDTPFYVSRESFRIAARGYLDQETAMETVNTRPEDEGLSRRYYQTGYQRMRSNYLYVVSWSGTNSETGEPLEQSAAVWSNDPLTTGEVYADAENSIANQTYPFELFDLSVSVSKMYHKSASPW